ncbi:peptidoglycan recognition protein family protein [Mucisphaera sp.]|uniref:peptidoglycan recognition protein family protein n=1 Tax=Mucisphaera sp. TaxID=2913024 RepID=UPI003D15357A
MPGYMALALLVVVMVVSTPVLLAEERAAGEGMTIRVLRHEVWSDRPPAGVEAHGIRRNLAIGDTVDFEGLSLSVLDTAAVGEAMEEGQEEAEGAADVDRVKLLLEDAAGKAIVTAAEGQAMVRGELRIAVVAIYTQEGELGRGLTVIEVATVDSLPAYLRDSADAGGAEQRLRIRHAIDRLTLHHSATAHGPEDDLGRKLAAMQSWGASQRNWWDVPYHYIVDLDGTVYQGRDDRYLGDTNTRYDTAGHFLINCYGNYNDQTPNEVQVETIARLMAWAVAEYEIEPIEIFGHRDLASTSCPGDHLQALIEDGTLERRVREILEEGVPRLVWVEGE